MLDQRWEQVFTVPDNTKNQMGMLALSGSHWLNDRNQLSGLVYYRSIDTNTLNGDANDEFEDSDFNGDTGGAAADAGAAGCDVDTAVNNRTQTKQSAYGLGLQWTNVLPRNRVMLGASYDAGRADFTQSSGLGVFNANRCVMQTQADRAGELAVRNHQHLERVRDRHLQDHAQAVPHVVGALQQHPGARPRTG